MKTFPTNILAYSIIHNKYFTSVYIEDKDNMICHICQYIWSNVLFNKDKKHFKPLCYTLCASTSIEMY